MIRIALPEAAVDAVRHDHEICVREQALVIHVGFVAQRDAELLRTILQDQQQGAARAAAEAVAADPVLGAPEMDGDVVPIGEFPDDALIARQVVLLEIVQGRVGEHDAEAEGLVGAIALIDRDVGFRPELLQQDREIKPRRAAADDRRLHEVPTREIAIIILSLK